MGDYVDEHGVGRNFTPDKLAREADRRACTCGWVNDGKTWVRDPALIAQRPSNRAQDGGGVMGYFSNGTEGELYQEQWCARCWHDVAFRERGEGIGCPIWGSHLLHNYERDDAKVLDVLNRLIPRNRDGLGNKQCRMFIDKSRVAERLEESE